MQKSTGKVIMRATLKFLSEQSGLSIAAISLILNDKPVRVSPEKKILVKNLAKQYNYKPNMTAVALVTKKTKTIGLILPDIVNPFFAVVASEINQKFHDAGYNIILCNTNNDIDLENKYAGMLEEKQLEALIICASDENHQCDLSGFYDQNIPVIFFDRYYADSNYIVSIDNTEGARQAVKYLIENGHQNIAMITGPLSYRSARTRIDGYKEALVEAGLQVNEDYIVVGDYTFDGGQRAAKIIGEFDEVTAVFASNDLMAYGAMKEFSDSGKNVPNDISIVGFDDLNFSQMLRTPLTSVKQNLKELAENVFGLTMRAINGHVAPTHKVVATNLIERDSVVNRESVHNISAVK